MTARQYAYPDFLNRFIKIGLPALLAALFSAPLPAQEFQTDTLRLNVYFRRDVSRVEPDYRDNGKHLQEFRDQLDRWLQDSTSVVRTVIVRTAASPEGSTGHNQELAEWRARSIDRWLTDSLQLDPGLFRFQPVGEDWEGLAHIVSTLDMPWRDEVLDIIANTPVWVTEGGSVTDSRKSRLMRLEGGTVWSWLDENVFPELRAGSGSVSCIVYHRVLPVTDTVFVAAPPADTVYVDVPVVVGPTEAPARPPYPGDGRKMIFALRTNFLAVPFTNVGIEVPICEHWSVGADWYSPWLWRPRHGEAVDTRGWCFEFQAADIEARYWFTNKRKQPAQRLLGHSIGIYGAVGHYDFERDWHGHQGEFWNVGVDYLYAVPIFRNRMHLEFELGVGFIRSRNQAYECLVEGDVCYRTANVKRVIDWFGPTRAQISLVLPIYVKTRSNK